MIVEMFLKMIFGAINNLINTLPDAVYSTISNIEIPLGIKHAAYFFPLDCLTAAIASFLSWYGILMAWGVVEWLYKKIPGVD